MRHGLLRLPSTTTVLVLVILSTGCGAPPSGPLPPDPGEACCPAGPEDWPQWRGLHRDGRSPASPLTEAWPNDGPTVLLRRDVGPGFAGISVKGTRLYSAWTQDGHEILFCLSRATGDMLWHVPLGEDFEEEYGNGPRSTPTVADDGSVYAVSSRGVVVAVDEVTGKTRWKVDVRREARTGSVDDRGFSSSPLVHRGMVFLNMGPRHAMVALDARDGGIVWVSPDAGRAASGSPVLTRIDGIDQLVTTAEAGLIGVALETGDELWRHPWETRYGLNIATPVVVSETDPVRVLISAGYDHGAALVEIRRDGENWTTSEVWTQRQFRNHFSTSVFHDGYFYGFDNGILVCVDAATGEVQWKHRGFGKGSLLVADQKLVVLGEEGNLGLLAADPAEPRVLAEHQILNARSWIAPSLAGSDLFLRNGQELVGLSFAPATTTQDATTVSEP